MGYQSIVFQAGKSLPEYQHNLQEKISKLEMRVLLTTRRMGSLSFELPLIKYFLHKMVIFFLIICFRFNYLKYFCKLNRGGKNPSSTIYLILRFLTVY